MQNQSSLTSWLSGILERRLVSFGQALITTVELELPITLEELQQGDFHQVLVISEPERTSRTLSRGSVKYLFQIEVTSSVILTWNKVIPEPLEPSFGISST